MLDGLRGALRQDVRWLPAVDQTWRLVAERARQRAGWFGLGVCLLTVVALYGRTLTFPFFYDDSFDLTRTESQSFLSLLGGIHDYAYYRPVPFLIWKLLFTLQGRYDPMLLHGLTLASHLAAGWVLFLLLHRLTGQLWALVPALLFLSFPDSYQVVAVAGSLFHALVAAALLASLYCYLRGRTSGSWVWLAGSVLCLALALWTHEYGVLGVVFLVALELYLLLSRQVRRPSAWLLAHAAVAGLFLLVWLSVSKAPSPVPANRAELAAKGLFFLQGLAFPATAQLVPLQDRLGWAIADRTLLAGGGAVLLALGAYLLAGRRIWLAAVGLAWALVALLPVWWRLNWPYVENAPRLLYLSAAGAAVFWGMLLSLRWRSRALTVAWRAAGLLALLLVLAQSARFVGSRINMLTYGGQLVDGVAAVGTSHPGGSLLFANVPSWFVLHQADYARGHLGVTMMPSYIGLDRVIYAETGAEVRVDSIGFRADTESWRYGWQPHGAPADAEQVDAAIRQAERVYVADMAPERLSIREVGGLLAGSNAVAPLGSFAAGVDVERATVSGSSGVLALDLLWRVRAALPRESVVVVVLRDPAGATVAEWRGYALNDLWAPGLWRRGDRIDDRSVLRLPVPARSGPYSVWLGLASSERGELLPLATGTAGGNPHLLRIGQVER